MQRTKHFRDYLLDLQGVVVSSESIEALWVYLCASGQRHGPKWKLLSDVRSELLFLEQRHHAHSVRAPPLQESRPSLDGSHEEREKKLQ